MFACARLSVLTIVLGVMCVVSPVQAGLYGFQNITGNNPVDAMHRRIPVVGRCNVRERTGAIYVSEFGD